MAFYDNKYWILSHIRNSFLYSDDTGMCEMILQNTDIPKEVREEGKRLWFGNLDDSEEEYDDDGWIQSRSRSLGNGNEDFGTRRRRLNTVVRLEKMRKEQQAAAMISTVRWKEPDLVHLDQGEKSKIFNKKEVAPRNYSSVLTKLLADHADEPDSPFVEYAKFDGHSQLRAPTRTIRIFLTMQTAEEQNYPMTVCVIASAKVFELIGLVCYKYNHEKREPFLSGPVENYALYIAEDDGSPDADFPCLEPKEAVGKFGFTSLALVRASNLQKDNKKETETVKEVEQASTEKREERGTVLESTDYHSFKGYLLHKVRPKTEITLGISWDQVEIKPCPVSRSVTTLLWSRPSLKPTRLPMEVIVDCVAIQTVPASVAVMYYHTDKRKWRRLRIECDTKTIDQVVAKLRFILEIRGGLYRQEYLHHVSYNKRASLTR